MNAMLEDGKSFYKGFDLKSTPSTNVNIIIYLLKTIDKSNNHQNLIGQLNVRFIIQNLNFFLPYPRV